MAFETLDYLIFAATLFISAAIGVSIRFSGDKQRTNEEYLAGNRKQNPIIVAVSLMSTFMSAVSMLGGASEAYTYGTHFFTVNFGFLVGIVIGLIFYVPVFYELKCFSVYTYLQLRFGNILSTCASLAFVLQMILYSCIALAAPAIALQTVINISNTLAVIIVGLVCTFYATLGGIKAVIFTDLFQSTLMFCALISIIYAGLTQFGGFRNIINIAEANDRIDLSNFSLDPTIRHTWLSTLVGGIFNGLFLKGINQVQIQRYLTMKDYRSVILSALLSWPLITLLSFSLCFCGLIAFAKYEHCDPIRSKRIKMPDQLLPLFVMDTFEGSGLTGIFVSGVFSASLSTISPLFNSLAAVTLEDHIKPLVKKWRGTEIEASNSGITQILACLYGVTSVLISLLALKMKSILQTSIIAFSIVGGPMLGVYTLGMFSIAANEKGTLIGFITGIVGCTWISIGQPRPLLVPLPSQVDGCDFPVNGTSSADFSGSDVNYLYLYRISYMYFSFIGFFITYVTGYLFSLLIKPKSKRKLDPRLFIRPIASRLLKYELSSNCMEMDNKVDLLKKTIYKWNRDN